MGDAAGICKTHGSLGSVYEKAGDHAAALEALTKQMRMAEEIGNLEEQCAAMGSLGLTLRSLGRYDDAVAMFGRQLKMSQDTGDVAGQIHAHGSLSVLFRKLGRHAEAMDMLSQQLELADDAVHNRRPEHQHAASPPPAQARRLHDDQSQLFTAAHRPETLHEMDVGMEAEVADSDQVCLEKQDRRVQQSSVPPTHRGKRTHPERCTASDAVWFSQPVDTDSSENSAGSAAAARSPSATSATTATVIGVSPSSAEDIAAKEKKQKLLDSALEESAGLATKVSNLVSAVALAARIEAAATATEKAKTVSDNATSALEIKRKQEEVERQTQDMAEEKTRASEVMAHMLNKYCQDKDWARAIALEKAALNRADEIASGNPRLSIVIYGRLAFAYEQSANGLRRPSAVDMHSKVAKVARNIGDHELEAVAWSCQTENCLLLNDHATAAAAMERCVELLEQKGDWIAALETCTKLSVTYEKMGSHLLALNITRKMLPLTVSGVSLQIC